MKVGPSHQPSRGLHDGQKVSIVYLCVGPRSHDPVNDGKEQNRGKNIPLPNSRHERECLCQSIVKNDTALEVLVESPINDLISSGTP